MRQSTHLYSMVGLQAAGFAAGLLAFATGHLFTDALTPPAQLALFVAGGFALPQLLFRFVLSAVCPGCGCRSYPMGTRPIVYECTGCGVAQAGGVPEPAA